LEEAVSYLRGIVVQLNTGLGKHSGTDDPIYVGVAGTGGGREFPLDVKWFDDFERRSRVKYVLGEVWDADAKAGAKNPIKSRSDWNDPALFYIDFEKIDRLYLRKHAGRRRADDDAYEMDEVAVTLYGESPKKRVFRSGTAIWLGIEYGMQVWIPEVDPDDLTPSLRT
jgi:hypothetical protein